jgi:hypothetical protein
MGYTVGESDSFPHLRPGLGGIARSSFLPSASGVR